MPNIKNISFTEAISERYLAYALSTITGRSLPDVRDGLKPVHRRLLYAMLQLKLDPKNGFKKCARVVGDVIGKYHPHGDVAVYDTMVRMAQSFSLRYPLVDGQGNFGSQDGDNPAAMRYTEARLTDIATHLLAGIEAETVDFRETYDNQDEEPVILPAGIPNLLANGSEGIAVGMATSIPPHNLEEIIDACLKVITKKTVKTEELVELLPAPDFPTGGTIIATPKELLNIYETGKGGFKLRAKWEVEEQARGVYQIVITEIPYQVNKSKLLEKLGELYRAKKLPLLADFNDESDENIRLIFEPKNRNVPAEALMESLFKLSDLEIRFSVNMNVLDKHGAPRVMGLREILDSYLEHRMEVLTRRTQFRLNKVNARLHILEGLKIAYLNIDEVIKIIREEDEAKQIMMERFNLSEIQVEAILNMRLRSLRKLEEFEINKEIDELTKEKNELEALLGDEKIAWNSIKGELKELKKKYGKGTELGARRSTIEKPSTAEIVSIEAFVQKEPITVMLTKLGWLRAFKGHKEFESASEFNLKEGDEPIKTIHMQNVDKLILAANNGKFYTISGTDIPVTTPKSGFGESIRIMVDIDTAADIFDCFKYNEDAKYLLAADIGKGFVASAPQLISSTRKGKQVMNVAKGSSFSHLLQVSGDMLAIIGNHRKLLVFPTAELPEMARGQGVRLQRYVDAKISDIKFFEKQDGLSWSLGSKTRTEPDVTEWLGKRGHTGRMVPTGFPRNNKFS